MSKKPIRIFAVSQDCYDREYYFCDVETDREINTSHEKMWNIINDIKNKHNRPVAFEYDGEIYVRVFGGYNYVTLPKLKQMISDLEEYVKQEPLK